MVHTGLNNRLFRFAIYFIVIIFTILFLIPAVFTLSNSLRSIYALNTFLPTSIHLENYKLAVTMVPYARYFLNSVIITGITVVLTTIFSAHVGFAFAKLRAPGKNLLFMFVLSTMMLPVIVTQIPQYILFSHFKLTGNYLPWVLWGFGGNPFFIFLYRQFFMNIPKDLIEAARIDGCSTYGIFWRIFIPNSVAIITTVVVLSFQGAWGDFMTPFMFLSSAQYPLATALFSANYVMPNQPTIPLIPVMEAATVLFAVPSLFIFVFGQKYLVEGMVTSGLKG